MSWLFASTKVSKTYFRSFFAANTNTENVTDEAIQLHYGRDTVMATIGHADGSVKEFRLSDFKVAEKL